MRNRFGQVLGTYLLLLLLPGVSGFAQDLPPVPVHLTAESADMSVDLSTPVTHAFSSTAKWKGYLDFLGKPGTERSLGQPDLFLPLLQDANDMTFLNMRGQLQFDNTDNSETNIGLAHRHMFQEWIIGGYGYYDRRNTEYGNHFNQFSGGLEALSVDWAFRVNGYLPEDKTETVTSGANLSVIRVDDQINVQIDGIVKEKALPGLDGEVGYLLPLPWSGGPQVIDETRLYVGGYHFFGEDNFESVTGPRGRLEMRMYDLPVLGPGSRFMMGVEGQWDEPRGGQAFGLVSLRIPFDVFTDKSKRKVLTGLDRRMLQPIIRDVDVVTSVQKITEILPALDEAGEPYPKIYKIDLPGSVPIKIEIISTKMYYQSKYLGNGSVEYVPPPIVLEVPDFDLPHFEPCEEVDPSPGAGGGIRADSGIRDSSTTVISRSGSVIVVPDLPDPVGIIGGCNGPIF